MPAARRIINTYIADDRYWFFWGFSSGSDGKAFAYNAGDLGSIPGSGRSPGEGISSILAWKIPWTEEPGRVQSMGSQRVGHDLATSLSLFIICQNR